MEQISLPTQAYDLLNADEREAVDNYLSYVKSESKRTGDRIGHYIERHIPDDMVRRSKGILQRPLVRAALSDAIRKASDEQDLSPQRLLNSLAAIADGNIHDYIRFGEFGDWYIDVSKCTRQQMAAIKSIKSVPTMYGNRTEITLKDDHRPTELLLEMMGFIKNPDSAPPLLSKPAAVMDAIVSPDADVAKLYSEALNND